jgi:hypothetical protein
MKTRTIGYWAATGLLTLAFGAGGAFDAFGGAPVAALLGHLGYPAYFGAILGVWKMLGAAAIAVPRFPRLKEWAYAGMFFDLSGAALSHATVGDGAAKVIVPLVLLALVIVSYSLRPATRSVKIDKAVTFTARPQSVAGESTLAA